MKYYKIGVYMYCITALLASTAFGLTIPDTLWTNTSYGNGRGYSVYETTDGYYIVAGVRYVTEFVGQAYLMKLNQRGDSLWLKTYGGTDDDWGWSCIETFDSYYVIGGAVTPPPSMQPDFSLWKVDTAGEVIRNKLYGGSGTEVCRDVVQTSDSGYILVGSTNTYGAGNYDIYLVKTDSLGDTIWTKTYGGSGADGGTCVRELPTGGFIIAGYTESYGSGGADVYLIKTDSDGDTIWTKTHGDAGDQGAYSVEVLSDGGFIIESNGASFDDGVDFIHNNDSRASMGLIRTDTNGDTLWTRPWCAGYDAIQTSDGGFVAVGTRDYGERDIYCFKVNGSGDSLWTVQCGGYVPFSIIQSRDGGYVIAGWESGAPNTIYVGRLTPDSLLSDDSLCLAFNGNRHLVRQPNTSTLHLVYVVSGNVIYTSSTDGGNNWGSLENLGQGHYPAICVDFQGNPCLTWTRSDTLVYKRKTAVQGWSENKYTFGTAVPSHPSILVSQADEANNDTVRILVRLNSPGPFGYNSITEFHFPLASPQNSSSRGVELDYSDLLDFPSIARDYENTLHATWTCEDTVRYASRAEDESSWTVWSDPFYPDADYSNHPFIETYGDSVYAVWPSAADSEVYRGAKDLDDNSFWWTNFSLTSTTPSTFPVYASGQVILFCDKSTTSSSYDIFWRSHPDSQLYNLSNTSTIKSTYPQANVKITIDSTVLYTAWQEGNTSPYSVKFQRKDITGRSADNRDIASAYFVTTPGHEFPSRHLVKRDSFISTWKIPVDIGHDAVTYTFPLHPDFAYKMVTVAYHEGKGKWKMKIDIDGESVDEIEYYSQQPETLETWIAPKFYQDTLINVVFKNDDGKFSSVGLVNMYQYEGKTKGSKITGTMDVHKNYSTPIDHIVIAPNPFHDKLQIQFQNSLDHGMVVRVYDVSGRIIRDINESSFWNNGSLFKCMWDGTDPDGQKVAQGVYFVAITDKKTGVCRCCKVLKID